MNDHVLLNLLNELGIRDKMQGLPSIAEHFIAFSQRVFIKFENSGTRMLDYVYHSTLK